MKLGLRQVQIQTHKYRRKIKKIRHKKCRSCGSTNLLTEGVDQFCCNCDWDTCGEYVNKGYMNNFYAAYFEHFPKPRLETKDVVELPKNTSQPEQPILAPNTLDTKTKKSA